MSRVMTINGTETQQELFNQSCEVQITLLFIYGLGDGQISGNKAQAGVRHVQ